jgi:hypothetical protein
VQVPPVVLAVVAVPADALYGAVVLVRAVAEESDETWVVVGFRTQTIQICQHHGKRLLDQLTAANTASRRFPPVSLSMQ